MQPLKDVVTTWMVRRQAASFTGHRANLDEFVAVHNAMTRKLVAEFGVQDPEFYTALAELATNAATLTDPAAKLMVNGRDAKND